MYNALGRYDCLNDMKTFAQKHCDFLNGELSHDNVIGTMKEIISGCNLFANAMTAQEMKAIVLELMFACDACLQIDRLCNHLVCAVR